VIVEMGGSIHSVDEVEVTQLPDTGSVE